MFGIRKKKPKQPQMVIQIYNADGSLRGFLKSMAIYYMQVHTTTKVKEAKKYDNIQVAQVDAAQIFNMSRGLYRPNVIWI